MVAHWAASNYLLIYIHKDVKEEKNKAIKVCGDGYSVHDRRVFSRHICVRVWFSEESE